MIVATTHFEKIAATFALIVVLGFCCWAWWDVHQLGKREMLADQVGADGAFTPPLGLTATTTTVGADASRREWPVASSYRAQPYDRLNDLIDEVAR